MNSEHKWRFWYHKTIYFSKLAICLTFEYKLFSLGNGVRGKIRPIFAQCGGGGLGIADQSGVFKISFKNIFKEALAK